MPSKKINKECLNCKKGYLGIKTRKYCSKECVRKVNSQKRRVRVEKVCPVCELVFSVKKSHAPKRKYCSYKCYGVSMRDRVEMVCSWCNKRFEKPKSVQKWNKIRGHKGTYCSRGCSDKGSAYIKKGVKLSKLWSLRRADKVFSNFIRSRADWCCMFCGKDFSEKRQQLHCSHFWGRTHMSTRFDPDNCIAACYSCHYYKLEKEKQGLYKDLMISLIGEEKYELLRKKHLTMMKRDDAILELMGWIELPK